MSRYGQAAAGVLLVNRVRRCAYSYLFLRVGAPAFLVRLASPGRIALQGIDKNPVISGLLTPLFMTVRWMTLSTRGLCAVSF